MPDIETSNQARTAMAMTVHLADGRYLAMPRVEMSGTDFRIASL